VDFYDGFVSGFAEIADRDGRSVWYQCELVSWDKTQSTRIFCLSPVVNGEALLSTVDDSSELPEELAQLRPMKKDFGAIIASDSYLEKVSAFCLLTADLQEKLPTEFPNYDASDFDFWKSVAYQEGV
jgi:hypothetical protein